MTTVFSVALVGFEPTVRRLTAKRLRLFGLRVEECTAVHDLMERQCAASLVLCDLAGMRAETATLLAEFRRKYSPAPIILGVVERDLSALIHVARGAECLQEFDFFIESPLDFTIIFDLLRHRDPVLREECYGRTRRAVRSQDNDL